ncbi:MAG TPA: O-antigen ligase family protein [Candidatus Bipolaricaulota bacterium]|nr:O-antigen ligase family protein [Candidatus Bipolaricaulota bacterium]
MLIFASVFTVIFAILAWKKLDWALILIALGLPSYLLRFKIGPIPMTVLELMILIVFAVWLIRFIVSRRGRKATSKASGQGGRVAKLGRGFKWLIMLFLLAATIGVIVSPDKIAALGIWKAYFIEPILLFIVLINTFKNKKDFQKLFFAFSVSAILISLFAIYQKFTGAWIPNAFWQAAETRRVTSIFGYPNAIGLFLAPIAIWNLGELVLKWQENSWLKRIFFVMTIVLSSLAIVFAQSEGAIAAMAVVSAIIFFKNKKTRWFLVGAIVLLTGFFVFQPAERNIVWEKLTLRDFSGQVRMEMWGETIDMLSETPIEGAGLAGYQIRVAPFHIKDYIEIYLYPHNIFLNFWSEIGLLGLATWFLIIGKVFWGYWEGGKKKLETREEYFIILMIFAVILIHGLVDVPYFKNDLAVFWWILMARLAALPPM